MKHPETPSTKIKLGGKEYELVYDFEAIAEAEDILNRPILGEVLFEANVKPKISFVRAMLFALAHPRHPELTVEQANALIKNAATQTGAWVAIMQALNKGVVSESEATESSNPQ